MSEIRVLIHSDDAEASLGAARERAPGAAFFACETYADLPRALEEIAPEVVYTIRFDGTPTFPRDALLSAPSVRWISVGGSGTDHLAPWPTERLTVTNAAGVAADMMAEYAIGGTLHFTLNFDRFDADRRARRWTAGSVARLAGQTLLIVGLGATGQATARRAKALGMTVIGTRASGAPTVGCDEVGRPEDLPTLLPRADALMLSVPLSDATRGLIGAEALAALPEGAILIDVSRGGVVDQTALAAALSKGRLRGAVIDVFETEPLPAASPFWDFENVILTPHCSSVYPGWREKSLEMFLENLRRFSASEALNNVVAPR
ncbi:MAG: D-2-hydroxyacid dehydrogenase [Pseudomonadota bacterium]